ncbi:hypothetical protein AB0O34_34755 [Sphaerisporangium sp. NPDC088356]|uniref:hypothetical protein n=1 Tax=Sphaerisporangium sp. NPDC088356 TaxID=3154871 RepID=UPI0034204BBD
MNFSTILPSLIGGLLTLGGVWVTQHFTGRRDKRQLAQHRLLSTLQARREAYVSFMRACDLLARHERQVIFYLDRRTSGRKPDERAQKILDQANDLVSEVVTTLASVEVHGSERVRPAARALHTAHVEFEPIFGDAYTNGSFTGESWNREKAKDALEGVEEATMAYLFACRQDLDVDLIDHDDRAVQAWIRSEIEGSGSQKQIGS